MDQLPVQDADGSALLRFEPVPEHELAHLDPAVPLTASLVVLWYGGHCLMVFNRFRQAWELPGGMIDPGETPRQAALRELLEESGQRPETLNCAGAALIRAAPDNRVEYLAIYRGTISSPQPFTPNDEMSDSTWWTPATPLPALLPIDAALARLCPSPQE
ncbi:NUDIX hydrolase [Kribbella sp. NPDC048915]|uniref:NUDIX hydrolase n=1 Tax=Kribbella sp. NPDC048915 TaxID=3155148 RepID=UPI0033BFEA04